MTPTHPPRERIAEVHLADPAEAGDVRPARGAT
jgi:hypothetical protein